MENQPSKEDGEKEAQQSAEKPLPEREVAAPAEPPKSEPTTQQSGNEPERRSWRDEWRHPQVIVNAVLAFITVGIGTIYYFQLQQMRFSTDANKRASDAAANAADSAKQSVEISRRSLELTAKNIELTQRSTELTQHNVELAQKNLEATRESLGYASKSLNISQQGMEAATTPWIDVSIKDVKRAADDKNRDMIEITYQIENHSDSSAPRVFAECYLKDALDFNAFTENNLAVMPRQTVIMRSRLLIIAGELKAVLNQINSGKMPIRVYVLSFNAMGKKNSFIETFVKMRGIYTITNTQINPSEDDVLKMMEGSHPK